LTRSLCGWFPLQWKSVSNGAIWKYFGDNLKIGLGYNFTDFSDDLTDLNYDHRGVFLNLTGSM